MLQAPGLRAAFVPELAMVGCSLEHDGVELLELRDGLAAYREHGATMGIPLLHPWANRLARPLPASELVHRDANGLPIHGVLPRALPFTVIEETSSRIEAQFDTHDHPAVLEVFRHPHSLTVEAVLDASRARDPHDAARAGAAAAAGLVRLPPLPAPARRPACRMDS